MNSLLIGLGGAGIASVATYAKMVQGNANQNDEFLYLDTEEYLVKHFPTMGNDFVLLGGGRMSLHMLVQRERYELTVPDESRNMQAQHFFSWFDENAPDNRSCVPLNIGSGANRMAARTMLFCDYNNVKHRIANKLIYVDENGNHQIRTVFVVSGTCGGTGSGIVIDILYLIQEICHGQQITQHPFINLLLIMPEGYICELRPQDVRYSKYLLNAYALFDELNACLKDHNHGGNNNAGMQMNKYRCCRNDVQPFQFEVFHNAILFDSVGNHGEPMSREQCSKNVANFLFALELYPMLSIHICTMLRPMMFGSANEKYIKGFAATGMYVAQTWEELTRKYVKEKFMYQMLHYGFGGSDEKMIENTMISLDDMVFRSHMDGIVKKHKDGSLKDLLTTLLNDCSRDQFKAIVGNINRLRKTSGQQVDMRDVFAPCNNQAIPVEMERDIQELLRKVCQMTYSCCAEWTIKYSLGHALMLAKRMQVWSQQHYKYLCERFAQMELATSPLLILGKQRIIRDSETMIHEYVLCLLFKNLSQDYLVHCIENLSAALGKNGCFEDIIDRNWEIDFTKHVFYLKNDSTKLVLPSLDHLIDGVHLAGGNDIERKYAELVQQSESGEARQLRYNLGNDHLLYTYKQKCLEVIAAENGTWKKCFDMNVEPNNFAQNVRKAFETYAQIVKQKAEELANAPVLSKPFSDVYLSADEHQKHILINKLNSFDSISLSTQYHLQRPSMTLYLADFNNMPVLQGALGMVQPAMNNHFVQSTYQSDRIVKLNVEFGYSPDDYRYYDLYKNEFDRCLQTPERYRHHQPFIDKRFMTDRKPGETLADMFFRDAEQDC